MVCIVGIILCCGRELFHYDWFIWKGWLLVHGFCLVADIRCSCYSLLLHCWLRLDIFRFKPWKEPSSHRCCALDEFFFSGAAVWSVSHIILTPSKACIYPDKSNWIQCLNHGMFWTFLVCLFSFYYIHCSHEKHHGITLFFGDVLWKYYGIFTLIYNVNSMLYEYDHAVSWCILKCHGITIVYILESMI